MKAWRYAVKSADDSIMRYIKYSTNTIVLPVYDNRRQEALRTVVPFMFEWFDKRRMMRSIIIFSKIVYML